MTGGGRNALTGNCLFLLTLRYLPSLGFAQPVGRQAGAEPGWVTVVGIERYWGRWWGWRDTRGCCCLGQDSWREKMEDSPHISDGEHTSFC